MEDGTNSTTISDCVPFNATYDELASAVGSIVANSTSSVLVARERITDPGYGYRYWVTFVGAAVIGDVNTLEVADFSGEGNGGTCSNWSVVTGSSGGVDVTAETTQHHVSVATQVRLRVDDAGTTSSRYLVSHRWPVDGCVVCAKRFTTKVFCLCLSKTFLWRGSGLTLDTDTASQTMVPGLG